MKMLLVWLRRDLGYLLLAVLISTSLWVLVNNDQNPLQVANIPGEVPVKPTGLPVNMIIANELQSVRVRVEVRQDAISRFSNNDFQAKIDLSKVQQSGTVELPVTVVPSSPGVKVVSVIPERIQVNVEEIRTETNVPVRLRIVDSLSVGTEAGEPRITPAQVTMTGTQSRLDQVDRVVAEAKLLNRTSNIDEQVQLVALDSSGEPVRNVKITPSFVNVFIPITQHLTQRAVTVIAQTSGSVAPGYAVSTITVDPLQLIITGEPSLLKTIETIRTDPVNLSGAQSDITNSVYVVLPPGIVLFRPQTVQVRVQITPISGQYNMHIVPRAIGLVEGAGVNLNTTGVDVIFSGPLPVLQNLNKPENIQAEVDLSGLPPGTHTVRVNVKSSLPVSVERIQPETISVIITSPPPPAETPPGDAGT